MADVRLVSLKQNEVVAEVSGIRERTAGEQVHCLEGEDTDGITCVCCRKPVGIWVDSVEKWAQHPAKCC